MSTNNSVRTKMFKGADGKNMKVVTVNGIVYIKCTTR